MDTQSFRCGRIPGVSRHSAQWPLFFAYLHAGNRYFVCRPSGIGWRNSILRRDCRECRWRGKRLLSGSAGNRPGPIADKRIYENRFMLRRKSFPLHGTRHTYHCTLCSGLGHSMLKNLQIAAFSHAQIHDSGTVIALLMIAAVCPLRIA